MKEKYIYIISFHYVTNCPQEMLTSLSVTCFDTEIMQSISE